MPEAAQPTSTTGEASTAAGTAAATRAPGFIAQHGRKVVAALAAAAGAAVLTFTTNSVSAALNWLVGVSYRPCQITWVPVDCPEGTNNPSVGICGCEDKRTLPWFREQLRSFKTAHVAGFDGIADDMVLTPDGVGNNGLSFTDASGQTAIWRLGVGYNAKTQSKDWCVRLYRYAKPKLVLESPVLCLDRSHRWWSKQRDEDPQEALVRTPIQLLPQ